MISDTIYDHLKDIHSSKVKSLISKATLIDPDDTISKVIGKMKKNDIYDVFYFDGKKVLSTNIRTLLNSKNIAKMKIDSFLYPIPHVNKASPVQKAANIMAHYRIRAVPVVENKKLVGVVTAPKLLQLITKKDNKWIKANLIYSQNPITVSSKDSLGAARKLMVSKRIDHLPVEDKGKIKHVLTSFHLLDKIIPKEGIGKKSMGIDPIKKLESRVGNIGSKRVPQCEPNDNLNKIIDTMLRTNTTCCLVSLWDTLQGIITYRDILSLLAIRMKTTIPLYIVGMPDDQKNVGLITSKFESTLKRLQKVYSEIQEAKVSVKQHRTGNKKEGKYDVSIMITTPHHSPIIYRAVAFDLSTALEELSQKLLRNLSKRAKNRSKSSVRKIANPLYK